MPWSTKPLLWTWPSSNVPDSFRSTGNLLWTLKRPVPRANETVKVYFELYIAQLIKVDEVSQIMETKLWLKQRWKRSFSNSLNSFSCQIADDTYAYKLPLLASRNVVTLSKFYPPFQSNYQTWFRSWINVVPYKLIGYHGNTHKATESCFNLIAIRVWHHHIFFLYSVKRTNVI